MLDECEFEQIQKSVEKAFINAVAISNVYRLKDTLKLSETSFAFYCESNKIDTEFLSILQEKRTF